MNWILYHHIVKPKTSNDPTWKLHALLFLTWALKISAQGRVEILNDPEFPIRVIQVGWDSEDLGRTLMLVADAERA
jgi:hypothetical protein